MASGAVYDAIRAYLDGAWTTTPIAWENEQFTPPDPPSPFLEVEMTGTNYGQQSLGASLQRDNRWDEEGVLFLNLQIPLGTGASQGRTYAKTLADLFRGTRLLSDSLEFRDAFIGVGRPGRTDGNWWLVPIDIEWRRMDA